MKPTILLSALLIFSLHSADAQTKKISNSQHSFLDSLLSQGETKTLHSFIDDDAKRIPDTPPASRIFDWDSVRTIYMEILDMIEKAAGNTTQEQQQFVEMISPIAGRYGIEDAGLAANVAYEKVKDLSRQGRLVEAQKYYFVANYFRSQYIDREKQRLLENAKRAELLVKLSRHRLDSLSQERNGEAPAPELDEAMLLCERYDAENRLTPTFQQLGAMLDAKYQGFRKELRQQRSESYREQSAGFKEIHWTVGASTGVFFPSREYFSPYTLFATVNEGGHFVQMTKSFAGAENDAGGLFAFSGQSIGLSVSYYLQDNMSVEVDFSYIKLNRQRPKIYPWLDLDFYLPEYSSTETYSTLECMTERLLRVKTGFRPLTGIGLGYAVVNAPSGGSFPDIYYDGVFQSPPAGKTESFRVIFRGGVEYVPSEQSVVSVKLLLDASLKALSTKDIAPLFIHPHLRVSLLL